MRINRSVFSTLMILLTMASVAMAKGGSSTNVLDRLVVEALENNPDLKVAEQRWQTFTHRVVSAGALPDPSLSFALLNYPTDTFRSDQTPMTGKEIKWTQKIPYPGKLASKTAMAEQQMHWYKSVFDDAKLTLAQQVTDAYYELYFQMAAITISQKQLHILDDLIRLIENNYGLGNGLQQDVLKAHVERSTLMDHLIELAGRRETAIARLNHLCDQPTTVDIDSLPEPILPPFDASISVLQQQALEERPIFSGYRAIIERAKHQQKLARLDYRPDFTLWGGYRFREEISHADDGTDFVSAGVSINLPLNRKKRDEGVAEARSALSLAHAQMNEMRNRVNFNIHDAYVQADKDHTRATLYKTGIIPQANQAYLATLSAYQVGQVDFSTLLTGLMDLHRYELQYQRAATDYLRNLARLNAAAGTSFDNDKT